MSEPYGKTKHFIFSSQHEECVIRDMIDFYLEHYDFNRIDILEYYKQSATEFKKEIDESPCFCGTCKAYRKGDLKLKEA